MSEPPQELSKDPRVAGKVAIVTGAGQSDGPGVGTGRATAILLARHGAFVVLVDRQESRAETTLEKITTFGGRARVVRGDVTDPEDCERIVRFAIEELGGLDVLVNNVGVSIPGSVVDLSEVVWNQQLEVNLKSIYLTSRYAVPALANRGGGSIVNVSSVGALRSIGFAAYSAAKGGMISLSREMAAQHGPQGVRVNVVVPGNIMTPMGLQAGSRQGNVIDEVKQVARAVLPLGQSSVGDGWDIGYAALFLASDESKWITGQVLVVDGGATATTPPVAVLQATTVLRRSQAPAEPSPGALHRYRMSPISQRSQHHLHSTSSATARIWNRCFVGQWKDSHPTDSHDIPSRSLGLMVPHTAALPTAPVEHHTPDFSRPSSLCTPGDSGREITQPDLSGRRRR